MSVGGALRLAQVHQAQVAATHHRLATQTGRLWDRAQPISAAELAGWLRQITPIAAAARAAAVSGETAYVAAYATQMGSPIAELPVTDTIPAGIRAGATLEDVYSRPTITVRTALAKGADTALALRAGRARAVQTIQTDAQLAARETARLVMAAIPRVVGYRRVTDGNACAFCVLASTQRYTLNHLMPIHPSCGCTVAPIIGSDDPGRVLNRSLVDRLMTADPALGARGANRASARSAAKARLAAADAVFDVHEHGELGPVLTAAGETFTVI